MRVISVRGALVGLVMPVLAAVGWLAMIVPAHAGQNLESSGYTSVRIKRPKVIKKLPPQYPPEVAALGIEGAVDVVVWVDAKGNPKHTRVTRSDNPLLNQAAMDSVRQWKFRPGSSDGTKMDMDVPVEVVFSLTAEEQKMAEVGLPEKSPVRPVYQVPPDYPIDAELVALAGEVVVEFVVGEKGEVQNPQVVKTTHSVFNEAALQAIKQWGFVPARENGHPKASRMRVPFVFKQPKGLMTPDVQIRLPYGPDRPELRATNKNILAKEERRKRLSGGVYPYAELLENTQETVEAVLEQDEENRVTAIHWRGDSAPPFRLAIEAMLEARGSGELPHVAGEVIQWDFNPYDGDVKISDAAAAILKKLRLGGEAAKFASEAELDTPLQVKEQRALVFPTRVSDNVAAGEAEVEFFVDETGRPQLPRIVSASAPAFGYAACQAIEGWRFGPPLHDGSATVVRVRRTVAFRRTD